MTAHAIVLAAGAGTRFGGGKLTSLYHGKPLVRWSVSAALQVPVESVIAVLGAQATEVRDALRPPADPRLRTVTCDNWRDGISASLACGIDALPEDASAALLFLGDMPRVSSRLAEQLLEAVVNGAPAALAEYKGTPAHPVAFARSQFAPLQSLQGDNGARRTLERLGGVARIDTEDEGAVFDIDSLTNL